LEPCTLDDATHIIWGGALQPLYRYGDDFIYRDDDDSDGEGGDEGGDDSNGKNSDKVVKDANGRALPMIELFHDATLRKTTRRTSKFVDYEVLRRAPLLRLPCGGGAAAQDALVALLEAGAVPGVQLVGRGLQRPANCGGREYAFCLGVLSPVYGKAALGGADRGEARQR
jgi:hypothetical protein